MDDVPSLKSELARRSLAETIVWCGQRQLISEVNDPEVRRQHDLARQAGELGSQAYRERNGFWNRVLHRDYTHSPLWRQTKKLLAQVDFTLAPLKDQLRSAALTPSGSLAAARSESERQAIVHLVAGKRAGLVGAVAPTADLQGGRLLAYAPDENLADGAARFASQGFFDDDNVPPWDTWVAFSQGILVSWVPKQLLALVQRGLEVHVEGCIRFLD